MIAQIGKVELIELVYIVFKFQSSYHLCFKFQIKREDFTFAVYVMAFFLLSVYVMAIIGVKDSVGHVWDHTLKQCANCLVYGWTQPEDLDTLQQCSRCKVLLYCDKECQKEHWMRVHKQHCKKLTEAKKKERSNVSISGRSAVSIYSHHPFPLEGLSGDLKEGLILVIRRIINKLQSSHHPAFSAFESDIKSLEKSTINAQRRIWCNRKVYPKDQSCTMSRI